MTPAPVQSRPTVEVQSRGLWPRLVPNLTSTPTFPFSTRGPDLSSQGGRVNGTVGASSSPGDPVGPRAVVETPRVPTQGQESRRWTSHDSGRSPVGSGQTRRPTLFTTQRLIWARLFGRVGSERRDPADTSVQGLEDWRMSGSCFPKRKSLLFSFSTSVLETGRGGT